MYFSRVLVVLVFLDCFELFWVFQFCFCCGGMCKVVSHVFVCFMFVFFSFCLRLLKESEFALGCSRLIHDNSGCFFFKKKRCFNVFELLLICF